MKKKDAALIIYNDGRVQVSIPKQKKDENVEVNVLIVTALAMLLTESDKQLMKLIKKQIKEFQRKAEKIKKEE